MGATKKGRRNLYIGLAIVVVVVVVVVVAVAVSGKKSSKVATGGTSVTTVPAAQPGRLLPAAVGAGQCAAHKLFDGSVYAQVAYVNTTCQVAADVAGESLFGIGDDYTQAGFKCTAVQEVVPGNSPWGSAWGDNYYAYTCVNGSMQVAFNWGEDYTYASL